LDIGTGSGCIAISLSLEFPEAHVLGIDISQEALNVAIKNTTELKAKVQFKLLDILNEFEFDQKFDLIVSNPPYISWEEKSTLSKNVLDFEPHAALFIPGGDALLFYRTIAKAASKSLMPGGAIVVEINEQFGLEVSTIFREAGLKDIQILKDFRKKDRIVKAMIS